MTGIVFDVHRGGEIVEQYSVVINPNPVKGRIYMLEQQQNNLSAEDVSVR